jgi:hypothetical protein
MKKSADPADKRGQIAALSISVCNYRHAGGKQADRSLVDI